MAWAERVYKQDIPSESYTDEYITGQSYTSQVYTDAPLPEPPPMFRAEPAVLEAELVIQGRSISRPITDGRVLK